MLSTKLTTLTTSAPRMACSRSVTSDICTRSTGSASIEPRLYPTLDRIANTLNEYPASTVTVVGHTDSVGGIQPNQELSARRAAAVADYLVQRGVQRSRMVVQGRGEAEPIADNSTDAGRAQNRRVEMLIRPA